MDWDKYHVREQQHLRVIITVDKKSDADDDLKIMEIKSSGS